jgi:hypothetical protein
LAFRQGRNGVEIGTGYLLADAFEGEAEESRAAAVIELWDLDRTADVEAVLVALQEPLVPPRWTISWAPRR